MSEAVVPAAATPAHIHVRSGATLPAIPEVETCIHCGLCLNQCPTYRVTHLEAESPRGRIYLVKAAVEGRVDLPSVEDHLYLCLMCRACETACPSGVQYGRIAEAAREVLGPPGPPMQRADHAVRPALVDAVSAAAAYGHHAHPHLSAQRDLEVPHAPAARGAAPEGGAAAPGLADPVDTRR